MLAIARTLLARPFSAVVCIALAAPAATLPEAGQPELAKARVEGQVISRKDGSPLIGATIRLRKVLAGLPGAPDPDESDYSAESRQSGRFSVEGVAPGEYLVLADFPGHVRTFYGVTSNGGPPVSIHLVGGQTAGDVNIALLPQGEISGELTNEDGSPLQGQVTAMQISYNDGQRALIPLAFTDTDAEGHYSLKPLPPGKYYVSAALKFDPGASLKHEPHADKPRDGSQDTSPVEVPLRTFYPSALDVSGAVPIFVGEGASLQGIGMRLKRGSVFRIHGQVKWTDKPGPLVLALMATGPDVQAAIQHPMTQVQEDGTFTFEGVLPGSYKISPERIFVPPQPGHRQAGGVAEVAVEDRDVSDVTLTVRRNPDLMGRVTFEGEDPNAVAAAVNAAAPQQANATAKGGVPPAPPPGYQGPVAPRPEPSTGSSTAPQPPLALTAATDAPQQAPKTSPSPIQVTLETMSGVSINIPKTQVGTDGTFTLPDVPIDKYWIKVAGLPEGAYLKSVALNGRDVMSAGFDLSTLSDSQVDIVISRDAGHVTGSFRTDLMSDDPISFPLWVSLWSTEADPSGGRQLVQVVSTDRSGNFQFTHVPPGRYNAVAWENLEEGLASYQPLCALFSSDAASVTLAKRATQHIDLKPIRRAEADRALARLH
jgi:protocatechuate 3,4-dioxygenase beta subunit